MQRSQLLVTASLLLGFVPAAGALSEYGIEGMHVVSTPASEIRASVSPDGQRIVWGSTNRSGGAGGWDLWQAVRVDGRWQGATPLPINAKDNDFDPAFSADGRWLYFFSNRDGGFGGDDLYRVAVQADGGFGTVENLGAGVNSRGDEWAPAPSGDGRALLFASDGFGGSGRHDLFVAHWDGNAFVQPRPVPGVNTAGDDFDAAWLDGGRAIVFTRSADSDDQPMQLFVAQCDGVRYADAVVLPLSFNSTDGWTLGPGIDWSRPGELLVSGHAKAPSAGGLDIYRVRMPTTSGKSGCT